MASPVNDTYSAPSGKRIAGGVVDTLGIVQGATLDFRAYAPGKTLTLESGTLPSGVTFAGGVFSAAAVAAVGESGDIVVGADDGVTETPPAEPGDLPLFGITSAVGGADLPFAFGHVFAKGDVPAGSYVTADIADWQATPTTYWPDGSLRHAIIAGRATCTANVRKDITLGTSTTAPSGAALTEANLASALPATTLVCGAETITLASLVGTAAKHRTVCAGPVMSNWLYRKQLAGSNHLVAWFDVRLYKGGAVEIFPWIENGYLLEASPTNDVRTYTLTIGGVQRFSQSIDIKHHTRVPLISGTAHSYWSAAPQITPKHDVPYLRKTRMVPNIPTPQDEAALANTGNYGQTYTPNWLGNTKAAMADTGFGNHIGILPQWGAGFVASGDPRAYRAVVVNGMAGGSWPVHYRDATTNEPLKFTDYPNVSINWGGSPSIPGGAGGVNSNAGPDRAHQPSLGFLPWLLTGRWYFLDEQLAWATWNYLQTNHTTRDTSGSVFFDEQTRSRAWSLRTLAQTLAALPSDHPCFASFKAAWEANTGAYEARYVIGARDGGAWKNELGWMGLYSSWAGGESVYFNGTGTSYWWDAHWMQNIFSLAFGTAWDMDLPQTAASKASHQVVRDFAYRVCINMAGDGSAYSYRRFAAYATPIGQDSMGMPVETWLTWDQVYAAQTNYGVGGTAPWAALPAGDSIYYGDEVVTAGHFQTSSGTCFGACALALAVDHGVAGAAEGWARITGSSSYAGAVASYATVPIWGVLPR